jgi:hypothetical protein
VTRDDAYEYWREHCCCTHFHSFLNETAQPCSTGDQPGPTISISTTTSLSDELPDLVSGVSADACSSQGRNSRKGKAQVEFELGAEVTADDGPLMFAVRGGKHDAVYAEQ